jgi:uncharacterized membrane protein YdjX (TVP38/TMEM64 family)
MRLLLSEWEDRGPTLSTLFSPMSIAASLADLSPIQFVIAVALAALLATAVFAHASKHGSRHATAWGVATFLFAGIVVPVYFVRYWLRRGRR